MKNAIVNLFKTLFFFDVAVVAVFFLPYKERSTAALTALSKESVFFYVLAALTFLFLFLVEKRKLKVFNRKKIFRHFLSGLLYGVCPIALTVALLWVTKHLRFTGKTGMTDVMIWLAALFLNTLATELLFRGYLFRLYRKYYSFPLAALFVSALFFSFRYSLLSMGKPYVINLLLLNILLCIAAEKTGSFTAPFIAHFGYRLISAFLLGSFPVAKEYPHLFDTAFSGKAWMTGGEKGLEASIVLLIIQAALIIWIAKKSMKGKKFQLPPTLDRWLWIVTTWVRRWSKKIKKRFGSKRVRTRRGM